MCQNRNSLHFWSKKCNQGVPPARISRATILFPKQGFEEEWRGSGGFKGLVNLRQASSLGADGKNAKTIGSTTIPKKKLLWQENGGRSHHRSPATAFFFENIVKPVVLATF